MFFDKIINLNNPYGICIVGAVIMILTMLKLIHIIQLNSYNLDQQILWYKKNKKKFISNFILLILIAFESIVIRFVNYGLDFKYGTKVANNNALLNVCYMFVSMILIPICLLVILLENLLRKQKKKLVFTNRIKRLIVICVLLFSLFFIPLCVNSFVGYISVLVGIALSPLIVFIAYFISLPIENSIRKKFMNEAHELVKANDDLYVLGITGSFGKTSVKYYLHRILQEKFSVCMTPESFNTAMGATLTIKNDLKNIDDIFICEMGARRVGDIKEICDIVDPVGAIITDVGNMHLDTFKNIENVCKTKFELVDAACINNKDSKLGKGIVLLNGDNDLIRERANSYKFENKNVYFYGLNNSNDFYASDISVSAKGTKFKLNSKSFKDETFETKLLGKYNIINLVAAISYAMLLGVDIESIKNAVKSIEGVPHRLQILSYGKDDILIDDAYNSNPKGARNAVDVISEFDDYKKIIITPGMVELNDKQDEENESFAEYAGKLVDYAVVVGSTNKESLIKGFEKTMSKDRIINFYKIEDAIQYVINNIKDKKVILLENDLSDNY